MDYLNHRILGAEFVQVDCVAVRDNRCPTSSHPDGCVSCREVPGIQHFNFWRLDDDGGG
ncbi:hypothetical protein [Ornithinimicrobium kibberense]|uniref:hypothetical protein n=1 Tax=Ornithinimicrobium kibberense TaxID=282060 RepID=UPI003606FCB3